MQWKWKHVLIGMPMARKQSLLDQDCYNYYQFIMQAYNYVAFAGRTKKYCSEMIFISHYPVTKGHVAN